MSICTWAQSLFSRYGERLALLGAFLVPVKLSLALIVLVPLTALSLLANGEALSRFKEPVLKALIAFFVFALFAAFFGIRPLKSIKGVFGLAFYASCFLPYFYLTARRQEALLALLCGQTLAGLHSVADSALNWGMPRFFPGRVTESGQLLVAFFALLALFRLRDVGDTLHQKRAADLYLSCLIFLALMAIGFSGGFFPEFQSPSLVLLAGYATAAFVMIVKHWLKRSSNDSALLFYFVIPVLCSALILNLKRGPWAGVLIGGVFLLWRYRRSLILPLGLVGIGAVVALAPIRDRVLESSQNFFTKGGRNTIWETALDVSVRFPLGIGVGNSDVLREFAPDVPEGLTHFHSNILNLLAETGWIGLSLFLAFLLLFIRHFSSRCEIPGSFIVALLIGWQVAGLVEYNIGDTEVLLSVVLVLGILVGAASSGVANTQKKC